MSDALCRQISEDAIELKARSAAHAQFLSRVLRQSLPLIESVPGIASVTVQFDPSAVTAKDVERQCLLAYERKESSEEASTRIIEIPIHYGGEFGPDLSDVCQRICMSEQDFITAHTSSVHIVDMIGFTPGFAYVSGLASNLNVPRLDNPRPRLAAGSVGISGAYTGIYSLAGPGGWRIVGQTDLTLFDQTSTDPFLLQPGQGVRFKAV